MLIEKVNGWHWPVDDAAARRLIPMEAARDITRLIAFCGDRRGLIVQAGGNTGWWPNVLAYRFGYVVTAEPHPVNYACMLLNDMPPNVRTIHAAFGEAAGWCSMDAHEPANFGTMCVADGDAVPRLTIDGLLLDSCDAIWLDVEGAELDALRGAAGTIAAFRPMIAVEEKGLGSAYGHADGAIESWLKELNYVHAGTVARDSVYLPA